jgi:hypothetical protein
MAKTRHAEGGRGGGEEPRAGGRSAFAGTCTFSSEGIPAVAGNALKSIATVSTHIFVFVTARLEGPAFEPRPRPCQWRACLQCCHARMGSVRWCQDKDSARCVFACVRAYCCCCCCPQHSSINIQAYVRVLAAPPNTGHHAHQMQPLPLPSNRLGFPRISEPPLSLHASAVPTHMAARTHSYPLLRPAPTHARAHCKERWQGGPLSGLEVVGERSEKQAGEVPELLPRCDFGRFKTNALCDSRVSPQPTRCPPWRASDRMGHVGDVGERREERGGGGHM